MRYLLIADIHGNLEAFQAVLEDAQRRGSYDGVWCLGDIVGYGPDPGECIWKLRKLPHKAVAGNHDLAATGRLGVENFNPQAAAAALWTASQLSPGEKDYLSALPQQLEVGGAVLAHGSPREPAWEYILSEEIALPNFEAFQGRLCLVGHSHVPLVFRYLPTTGMCVAHHLPAELKLLPQGVRYIVNPGGVGQPRDGDPRASYAIYDSLKDVIYHHRVPYDIASTQAKMRQAGLPIGLIQRLSLGR